MPREDSSLPTKEPLSPGQHLDLGLPASRAVGSMFLLFKMPSPWQFLTASKIDENTWQGVLRSHEKERATETPNSCWYHNHIPVSEKACRAHAELQCI